MRHFKTRLHHKPLPSERFSWVLRGRPTRHGYQERRIGIQWKRWSTRTTHWIMWGRSDNKWIQEGTDAKLRSA